ncbi:MAG: pilus assembly PilX N-terminal domain-containing protein [Deltaproteobacteria bacterium]|nr:MAG: pilus assembly PilX N-terminal domain-containing protein [Deltaproteobacteria bacterium]
MKILKKNNGMIFIGTLMAMLFFSALATTANYLSSTSNAGAVDDFQSSQAFYVADAGMQYTLMSRLNRDTNFSDNASPTGAPFGGTPITFGSGQFWIEYLNPTVTTVTVRITSKVGSAVKVISQNVTSSNNFPQYAVTAGGNFNSNSSTGVINGNIALTGRANIDNRITVNGTVTSDPSITMPQIDFNTYKAMCTTTINGNYTINSNYSGMLCVRGNVTINSNVTYTGLLYATGNINVNGNNVTINGTMMSEGNLEVLHVTGFSATASTSNPTQMMPALASKGNLNIMGSPGMRITGYVWAEGDMDFGNSDNYVFRGAMVAGGDFNGNLLMNSTQNLSITFDPTVLTGMLGFTYGNSSAQNLTFTTALWQVQ